MSQSFSDTRYEKIEILKQTLLLINEKYGAYDYRPQIYTDYLALYFRTVEYQIMSCSGSGLIRSLRKSFGAGNIQEAISLSDIAMLSSKHRLYLYLMKLGLVRILVMLRRIKQRMSR